MKQKRPTAISVLVGGMLLILVFIRGTLSQLLLAGFVLLWCVVMILRRRKGQRLPALPPKDLTPLLMRHVEGRITEQLHGVYPQAVWRWRDPKPEKTVLAGGTLWLSTENTGPYHVANVSFSDPYTLAVELVQTCPLQKAEEPMETSQPVAEQPSPEPPKETVVPEPPREDENLWFDMVGQRALTEIITDLNVQGCTRLLLRENGDVYAVDAQQQAQQVSTLEQMPSRGLWDQLKDRLTELELTVNLEGDHMVIAW